MMGYTILERENVPEVLKNKPRWMACAIIAMTLLAITTSAVAAGAFIGYTYCYLEHRHGIAAAKIGNLTQSTNFQIVHMPFLTPNEQLMKKQNRTINGALSSVLISRILKIGHALLDEDVSGLPWQLPEPSEMVL